MRLCFDRIIYIDVCIVLYSIACSSTSLVLQIHGFIFIHAIFLGFHIGSFGLESLLYGGVDPQRALQWHKQNEGTKISTSIFHALHFRLHSHKHKQYWHFCSIKMRMVVVFINFAGTTTFFGTE